MDPKANMADRNSIPEGLGYSNADETGLDELDSLAGDMDKEFTGNDDLISQDLGYSSDDNEEGVVDAEDEGDTTDEEDSAGDQVEGEEADVEAQEQTEGEEGDGDEEDDEEEFYNTERDFPGEKVAPTVYRDRVSLNSGVSAKMNYARELVEKLEGMESNLGAIELPSLFQGQEDFVKQPFDRSTFTETPDEDAKKAAFEMDKFINSVKTKLSRVESQYNVSKEKEQVTQEYETALDELTGALGTAGIPIQDATQLTQRQILQRTDEAIEKFKTEKFDEVYNKMGIDAANAELQKLQNARSVIEKFPEVSKRYREVAQKKDPSYNQISPEQMENSFKELSNDRPDLAMFKAKTDLAQRDFLEYVRLKIEKGESERPGTPRAWLNLYNDHQADRKAEHERYQKRKAKSSEQEKDDKTQAQKPQVNQRRKPPVDRVLNNDRLDRNELTTDDVDQTLDDLAKELDA